MQGSARKKDDREIFWPNLQLFLQKRLEHKSVKNAFNKNDFL